MATVLSPEEWLAKQPKEIQPKEEQTKKVLSPEEWLATQQQTSAVTPTPTSVQQPPTEEGFFARNFRYLSDALASGFESMRSNVKGEVMSVTGSIIQDIEGKYGPGAMNAPDDVRKRYETAVQEFSEAKQARDKISLEQAQKEKISPLRPETARLKAAMGSDVGFMESAKEAGAAILSNPVGVIADLGTQSLPASLYTAAVAMTSYFGTRSPTAAAVTGGTGSMISEFGNEYAERRERGESHEEAWKNAQIKTGVIGVFDAVSMNTAGKAAGEIVKALTKQKALGTAAKTTLKETGRQALLGGAGEAFGSLAVGEVPNPAQVMAEMAGEAFTGPVEGLSTYRQAAAQPTPKDQFDETIKKAEEEFLASQKAKQVTEEAEEAKETGVKEDPLKDADQGLIDEVKKYLEEVETSPKDTETNITKVLRNYATRLNLDPKKGGKKKSQLINYINRAIEAHEGPKPPSPEKLQEVTDYLQALNTGAATETGGSLFKKLNTLAGRASGIGISLEEGQRRNTENLLNALAKATGVDLGDYFKRSGAGPSVPGGPAGVGTAAGVTPPGEQGVGTAGTAAGAPAGGAGVGDTSVIDDLKDIWKSSDGLPIGLGGLTARDKKLIEGVNRARQAGVIDQVPAEIIEYVGKISKGRARRYQLQDDGTVEELATGPGKALYLDESGTMNAEEEINAIKDFYNKLVESFTKVREEGKEGKRAGLPTNWDALNLDERQLFLDSLGRERAGLSPLSQRFRDAFDKLSQYRRTKAKYAKQTNVRYDTRMDALASYEIDREAESNARGVEFPAWSDLTPEQQNAYIANAPLVATHKREIPAQLTKTGKPETKTIQGVSAEQSRAGFDAVEKLLEKPAEKKASDEAYTRAQREIEEEELGLKTPLPQDIEEDVKAGRLGSVLDYLSNFARGLTKGTLPATAGVRAAPGTVSAAQLDQATKELTAAEEELTDLERLYVEQADERNRLETALETAKGKDAKALQDELENLVSEEDIDDAKSRVSVLNQKISQGQTRVDPVTSVVNQLVAGILSKTLKNTKLVYLTNAQIKGRGKNPDEFIGEYDPKTDTMYIGERGLNETTMLHESTHAATVSVIYKYLTGKRNELTPDQIRGVVQIIRIYNQTKSSLGGRFPNAYANVYEFVAYATSVPKFQLALQNLKVKKEVVPVKEGEQQVFIDPIIYTNFFQTQEDIRADKDVTAYEEQYGKKPSYAEGPTAWQKFTQAMAQAIGLTYRFGRLIRNKITPQEYFDSVRKQTAKEVNENLETAEDQEGYEKFVEEVFGAPKKIKEGERDEALIKKLEKQLAKAESEYGATLENTRRLEERMKEMPLADRNKDPDYKAQKAKENAAFDKVNGIRDELYDAGAIEYAPKETKGERRKRQSVSVEPGYLGNAFLEVMGAFSDIAAAPPEGGLPEFAVELPIKLKKAKKAPTIKQPTYKEDEQRKADRMGPPPKTVAEKAKAVYNFFTSKDVWLNTVKALQNSRVHLYDFQKRLARAKALKSSGPGQNNTGTASITAGAISEHIFQRNFYKLHQDIKEILLELNDFYGAGIKTTLARLHNYAIFLHDPERRNVKFIKDAPLTNIKAVNDREALWKQIIKVPRTGFVDPAADAKVKVLWSQLETLVKTNLDTNSKYADPNNEKYNTLGPASKDYIDNVYGKVYAADPKVKDGTVKKLLDKLRRMDELIRELNQEANYYSNPVANLVAAYGFKNYFPFKGRPDSGPRDYQLDPFSQQLSGELQEKQNAFDGRITDADNPVVNFFVEAIRAARRTGRHRAGLEVSIKNNIENYNKGELGFKGKHIKKVSFEEQFDKDLRRSLDRGLKNIFVRNPDGSVDIYEISDERILNAIKKPIQQMHPVAEKFLDVANFATSLMGQYHTRYNLAFAPVDFIRNTVAYSGTLSAEYGPKVAAKLASEIASMVVMENTIPKTAKYSYLFATGNDAKLRALENSDPYYKDLKRYYETGSKTAYMQSLSYKDNLAEVIKHIDKNGLITAKEGVDRFLDAYLDMFEMGIRVAAYRVIRDMYVADGMPLVDAEIEAGATTKNLANFELVGDIGKVGGALYMFYRPTATGAVRALEAFAPAIFDFRSEKSIKQAMRKDDRYGTMTLKQIQSAYEKYDKQRKSGRVTIVGLLGFGALMYTLAAVSSGDDDEGRNKVLTDDTSRWTRTARFNTGLIVNGKDLVIQFPWGFGPGAFAALGAQVAAFFAGSQSFGKLLQNMADIFLESFVPLQVSKMEKTENPSQALVDTIFPSLGRPILQFAMNADAYGREIYGARTSKTLDTFMSNDSVPEMYRDGAVGLYELLGAEVSPNSLYFLANNYFDGLAKVGSFTYNWINIFRGDKGFDLKTDTLFLDGFLKTTSNYDARQFSSAEEKIRDIERKYNAAKKTGDPMDLIMYTQKHPYDKDIIDYHNKFLGSELKKLRQNANDIRANKFLTQQEREKELRINIAHQNILKKGFIEALKYREDLMPEEPMIPRTKR